MKTRCFKIIGIILMAMSLNVQAQEKQDKILKEISSYTGEITKWRYNLNYVYNAFELKVGDKTFVVEIPTGLGNKIRSLGNMVTVNGFVKENKNHSEEVISFISIQAKGEIIHKEEGETWSFLSAPDGFRSGKGKVTAVQSNNKGETIGIIVDNYTVLRIPKHTAKQLSSMIQAGKTAIEYTGMERKLNEGEMMRDKYKLIHCHTITIEGTQYLVR